MTPAGLLLADEIARTGPIPFRRFMEVALYHPEHGYYRRGRDPFGTRGDYFTAEQLQPVFGALIAARVGSLWEDLGRPRDFVVVELGAGRGEMAEAFSAFRYVPVECGGGWPERFCGVVFANEFFDALPVDVAVFRDGAFRELRVDFRDGNFVWLEGPPLGGEAAEYARRHACAAAEGMRIEIPLEALRWIDEIARRLERGFLFVLDYGYTARELTRFPEGTLMSYRRHCALPDVLAEPGERDITAHVCFTALEDRAARGGFERVAFESLAQTLLDVGRRDEFAAVLEAPTPAESLRRRLQLKTLLFGLGESHRTLLLQRGVQ
ncbi:MAG: SAM-dependent methyltransferase [Bryobacterales bacterium]|nr:SAM-dependent methyltransferase [Bryobacteraceae bacterium]MDW8353296.1 SAM-dependent methyltransferase [Bryobacterales bacterium]